MLSFILAIFLSQMGFCADTKVAIVDYPPLGWQKDNSYHGIGVQVVRELAKRTNIKTIEIFSSTSKFMELTESEHVLFPVIAKNADREPHFQWIGKILEDRYCFATNAGNPKITSLDVAKNLKTIAVNAGGATEGFLKKAGFTNLDPSVNNLGSVRKLLANRVDAWFSSEQSVFHTLKENGTDPKLVVCSGEFAKPTFWIAASKKVPPAQIQALKDAFAALEKDGFIKNQIGKFQN